MSLYCVNVAAKVSDIAVKVSGIAELRQLNVSDVAAKVSNVGNVNFS